MKYRDSGMPEENYWETLFDVPFILIRMGIGSQVKDVAELGCGYGTFTIPVARRINGTLYTFDIEPTMVERTWRRAREEGLNNIHFNLRDVASHGFGLPDESVDTCLLFNILHGEEPVALLQEAARITRPEGSICIIHWRHDSSTPRGPELLIRPKPEQIASWASDTGELKPEGDVINLPPWHFGMIFCKSK